MDNCISAFFSVTWRKIEFSVSVEKDLMKPVSVQKQETVGFINL